MKRINLIILGLLLIFLTGCGNQILYMCKDGTVGGGVIPDTEKTTSYYCPDGKETSSLNTCKFEKPTLILKEDAEDAALAYVKGYVTSSGWQVSLINVYKDVDWKAQLILSKKDNAGYETIVMVDSTTGTVKCEQNCEYI